MPDSKRFLPPDAIRRISRLEMRARYIVEGFMSGTHRSPYFGQSVEFLQHREYVPGDDLRHVDWQVWARQDRLYVKQFEEDTNMCCTILVDVSGSMDYGKGPLTKLDYAQTIAACLAYLILKQQDAVGCITFDEQIRTRLPIRSKRNHLDAIVHSFDQEQAEKKTDLLQILKQVADEQPRRGMMIVISDFFADVQRTLRGLKMLRQCNHDVLVFHVMDDDELTFPFRGPTRFEGMEDSRHLNCNPRALRDGYLAALETFLADLRHGCAAHSIDYSLVKPSQPLDAVLATYLSRRLGLRSRA